MLCVRKSYLLIAVNGKFLLIEKKNSGYDLLSLDLLVFCTPLRSVMSIGKAFTDSHGSNVRSVGFGYSVCVNRNLGNVYRSQVELRNMKTDFPPFNFPLCLSSNLIKLRKYK